MNHLPSTSTPSQRNLGNMAFNGTVSQPVFSASDPTLQKPSFTYLLPSSLSQLCSGPILPKSFGLLLSLRRTHCFKPEGLLGSSTLVKSPIITLVLVPCKRTHFQYSILYNIFLFLEWKHNAGSS